MHIAFNGWFWDQPYTGSGQYIRSLLSALQSIAPDVRLSLAIPAHIHTLDRLPPNVDVLPVPTRFKGHLGKVWFEDRAFPRAAARLNADIAHVPYWGPPLRCPMPLVCTVLDAIPLVIPEYRAGLKNRLYTSLVAAAAKGSNHILTISEASKADIVEKIGIPPDRVTVTHLGVDPVFSPEADRERDRAVRERYGLDDVDDFVLYLGSYVVHKNIRLLIAAYSYVAQAVGHDVPLVLAGRTPSNWESPRFPDIPAAIKELELEPFVRWIGPVAEADKPALYREARVFVFPSRYEGFGLGPLEAMASGTPVVACNASSVPEVTGDAAYLVDPSDSRGMGGAILSLLLDDQLAGSLREKGLARAKAFSWQRTAEITLNVYRRLLRD